MVSAKNLLSKMKQSPFLFLAPYLLLFMLFKFWPIIENFWDSLLKLDIIGTGKLIGLKNYGRLATDKIFWRALVNTVHYLALLGPFVIIGGFLLALLLNQPLRGRTITRALVFMPYVMMVTVVGALWRWILDGHFGILNHYLRLFGLGQSFWLTDSSTAMWGIVIATIWWTIGYNTVIFLAGLQDVPAQLLEAAEIDGAGPARRLRHVVIPFLRPTTFLVILTTIIYSLQVFGQIYTMTGGGPEYSTVTLVQYLYVVGFRLFNMGYASAISVVLFLLIAAVSALVFGTLRQSVD